MSIQNPYSFGDLQETEEITKLSFVFQPTDIALIVEEKRFHVNKHFLKHLSPVFKAMLEGDFNEKEQKEIHLPGKSYSDFKLFLKIFYLNKRDKLTVSNVIRIYPLTDEYQTPVTQRCEDIMMAYVSKRSNPISSIRNLIGCLRIAETYDLEKILKEAITTAAHTKQSELTKCKHYDGLSEATRLKIAQQRVALLEPIHYRASNDTNIVESRDKTTKNSDSDSDPNDSDTDYSDTNHSFNLPILIWQ